MAELDPTCICTHPRSAHYTYILNGRSQMRCQACDPFTDRRVVERLGDAVNVVMEAGTYVAAMDRAADHEFEEAKP